MKDTVLESFSESVQTFGDRVAISDVVSRISYSDLDRRSNQYAHFLCARGIGVGSLVALSLERSAEVVVAILGILKSGGAYVPLDPSNPAERLNRILEDARPAVILTESGLSSRFEGQPNVVCVDVDAEIAGAPTDAVRNPIDSTSLAYVIYTSGTTGRPKGVMITHRNLVSLLRACEPLFQFDHTDVWTMFHSYGFDVSVWEMWGALAHGGRLTVPAGDLVKAPDAFYQLLLDENVTVLCQTPSAFTSILNLEDRTGGGELSLRYIIFAGEALDPLSLGSWFERHGDVKPRIVNMYGITETTIHSTFRPITQNDCTGDVWSPIGRALPHLEIRILGEDRATPVPQGEVGEIFVLGEGVAQGYLNQPDLTRERFIAGPDGTLMYRSGDLARQAPDGDLHYQGRVDTQVQIRGFRVELGEIEAALRRSAAVAETAVIYQTDRTGGRIRAYVVSAPDTPFSAEVEATLRQETSTRLPGYMLPSEYFPIDHLPLTSNGKIDRSALAEMTPSSTSAPPSRTALTPTMIRVAGIWVELLKLESVDRHTDFFQVGGHSLLAVEAMIRIQQEFGIDIPLGTMFEHTTLESVSSTIDEVTAGTEEIVL